MNRTHSGIISSIAVGALLAAGMAACGGSGDGGGANPPPANGGGGNPPPSGGIDGVGISIAIGPITGFGSIFVNGIEFSTSTAQFRIEDSPGTESELGVGDIVEVRGTVSRDGVTGTAEIVAFNDSVEGPVGAVDVAAGTLVVIGQTVRVTGTTVFDNSFAVRSLAGIQVGDVVEVSGFPNASGEIVATRIEPKPQGGVLELFGVVSAFDGNARRFNVSTTTVDYSGAQLDNGMPANGACVEVKGNDFAAGVLQATRVEVRSCTVTAESGDLGEIEGIITRFASPTDFDIGSQRVTTTASTVYEGGTSGDLRANLKIEAEGAFNASGVLVADKIEIKRDTSSRLLGTIDSLDAGGPSFEVFGITVLAGVSSFEDKSSANQRPFGFADLRSGDYVEVRGFEEATAGTMTAVLIERDDLDARRELRGIATSVARPTLTILGVSVTTVAGTEYRSVTDQPIDAATFFAAAPGRSVEVRGTWNGSVFTAARAELED